MALAATITVLLVQSQMCFGLIDLDFARLKETGNVDAYMNTLSAFAESGTMIGTNNHEDPGNSYFLVIEG